MKKLLISALVFLSSALSAVTPAIDSDKLYLTPDELCLNYFDGFYIHLGNNVWVKTGTIHRAAEEFISTTTVFLENGNVRIAICTGRLEKHVKTISAMEKDKVVRSEIMSQVACIKRLTQHKYDYQTLN